MMKRWGIAYLATALTFVALDFVWLTQTAGLYRHEIGPLLLDHPRLGPEILFYLAYLFGVVLFVVMPGLKQSRWISVAGRGGMFGLIAYGTYDLTNLATLKGFSVTLTVVDLAWGFAVTGVAATVGYLAARRFG